jgi:peptidyl-tRNA hydrolase ICT1
LIHFYKSSEIKSTAEDLKGEFNGHIPMNELTKTFSCSSGPGGQNVNKVATKVDVRFHVESATWLTPDVKYKILEKYGKELTKDGWMVIKSDRTRSQTLNVADALEKLRNCIRTALEPPKQKFSEEEKEKIRKGKRGSL